MYDVNPTKTHGPKKRQEKLHALQCIRIAIPGAVMNCISKTSQILLVRSFFLCLLFDVC